TAPADATAPASTFSAHLANVSGSGDAGGNVSHQEDYAYETLFEYDLLDRVTQIQYPKEPVENSRLTTVYRYKCPGVYKVSASHGAEFSDIVRDVKYNEFGQIIEITRGNGVVSNYEYDIKGRLANLTTTTSVNGLSHKLQDVEYSFDVENNIKSVENRPEINTESAIHASVRYDYNYDGLNRLSYAKGVYKRTSISEMLEENDIEKKFERGYNYSLSGNLLTKNIFDPDTQNIKDAWNYHYWNHAVNSVDTSDYGADRFVIRYDAVGNMISHIDNANNISKELSYDSSNRIRKVTNPDTGVVVGRYDYDYSGFRLRKRALKEIDGEICRVEVLHPSIYFGIESVSSADSEKNDEDINEDTDEKQYYVVNNIYMNGVRIAAVVPDGKAMYYLTDQVDSVKVIVDDSGMPVSSMEYLPYGEVWIQEGDNRFSPKYNSQEFDDETNFYYYNARHFDPVISRFVTADSYVPDVMNTQSWNRYSYAFNNPIIYKDPTGHEAILAIIGTILKEVVVAIVKEVAKKVFKKIVEKVVTEAVKQFAKKAITAIAKKLPKKVVTMFKKIGTGMKSKRQTNRILT
ncbi:MAG: RHS repeat-associated core domain-containing protein, partial [Spirochaetota bacterium]|nr:RHS repeat-associated core domain-containing protein [Spirochaetota bacterium]